MPSARNTVTIERPVAEVFAFFTDPANDQRWRTHVREISSTGPLQVGGRVHQVIAGPMGRGIPADIEVTALEPGARYGFVAVQGPVRPRGEFTFREAGQGTEVGLELAADLTGIKRILMSGSVQKAMDGEVSGLERARAILEGGG